MALAFTDLSWWLWSGIKHQENKIPNSSTSLNSSVELGLWDSEALRFPVVKRGNMLTSSSRRVKRKWHSREERKIEREFDVVVVPSDGVCFSGSESEDSDWSIGWMEPHAPGFLSDDESESSFAVLVPCYGRGNGVTEEVPKNIVLETFVSNDNQYFSGLVNLVNENGLVKRSNSRKK
ncbi:hypothetical protein RJ641_031572 [Dillenia turbinata]|uniref:Uncharacterized protein n=1 Tax=Dillenia turbinata TaxID=194707 RepID=A0AAN8VQB7_9MAGN